MLVTWSMPPLHRAAAECGCPATSQCEHRTIPARTVSTEQCMLLCRSAHCSRTAPRHLATALACRLAVSDLPELHSPDCAAGRRCGFFSLRDAHDLSAGAQLQCRPRRMLPTAGTSRSWAAAPCRAGVQVPERTGQMCQDHCIMHAAHAYGYTWVQMRSPAQPAAHRVAQTAGRLDACRVEVPHSQRNRTRSPIIANGRLETVICW
jgi:hypothetical protein